MEAKGYRQTVLWNEIEQFESLIDYAHRSALIPYDDGRRWFFLQDDKLKLGEVASAVYNGDIEFVTKLIKDGRLIVMKTIRDIPGDHFFCIYFEDAYFLKAYNPWKYNR